MSIYFTHPVWGEGVITDYRDGFSFLSFPGSMHLREKIKPAELIWRSHKGKF